MVRKIDWDPDLVMQMLITRSRGLCEARTWKCLAPGGRLEVLPRHRVSIQHRLARGMGGSRRHDIHELPALLVLCGDGVTGCHGWVEARRPGMEERGLWVRNGVMRPGDVPVILASGEIVKLGPFYEHVGWHAGPIPGDPVADVTAGLSGEVYDDGSA